jgi:flavin reductase (DIM6/NTAB) family NADH-FMN oxidoreductase RutF
MASAAGSDPQTFRDVVGRFATGVTIITTHHAGIHYGMTASAVSSLSLEPPMLLVCINRAAPTGEAVRHSGVFIVNVLGEDQADLAQRFATRAHDKFAGVEVAHAALGPLTIVGALAHIECRVVDGVDAGTHTIFIGRVERAEGHHGAPLAYFRGQYGQLHLARQHPAAGVVREHILSTAENDEIDPDRLADELGIPVGQVSRMLADLAAQGLLSGDPVRGYRAAAITTSAIADVFDARCAIELGAAQLGVGRATHADLADLRLRAEHTVEVLTDGDTDLEHYARTNAAFHETLVGLAGSPSLLDAYRGLGLPGILLRGLGHAPALSMDLAEDHVAITTAYEAADLAAAQAAIIRHTERTKATHVAAIAPA